MVVSLEFAGCHGFLRESRISRNLVGRVPTVWGAVCGLSSDKYLFQIPPQARGPRPRASGLFPETKGASTQRYRLVTDGDAHGVLAKNQGLSQASPPNCGSCLACSGWVAPRQALNFTNHARPEIARNGSVPSAVVLPVTNTRCNRGSIDGQTPEPGKGEDPPRD